jgi:hypothetical protein
MHWLKVRVPYKYPYALKAFPLLNLSYEKLPTLQAGDFRYLAVFFFTYFRSGS